MRLSHCFMLSLFLFFFSSSVWALNDRDLPREEARAKNGNVASQVQVGDYYYSRGRYAKALPWYRLAAKNGQYDARQRLSYMYEMGEGTDRDLLKAYVLTRKIQNEYPNRHSDSLETTERRVRELAGQLTPEQLKQAEQLIKKDWKF
ncbi:hypothetical protein C4J81_00675 [Deltaproteobacteria bacterium Smac51]|nr:hypothetical protein C4J81_00675 [Deltaproteobacteria bacterium Smac51]